MSSIVQSAQPIIIPDPTDPTYGPSGGNVAKYTTNQGTFTITLPAILSGNASTAVYTFNNSNYNNSAYVYRITVNYEYPTLTFATTPTGNLSLILQNSLANTCQSTSYVKSNVSGLTPYVAGSFSAVFRGGSSVSLQLFVVNDTGANLNSGGTLRITSACIETVTTAFTNVSNFT